MKWQKKILQNFWTWLEELLEVGAQQTISDDAVADARGGWMPQYGKEAFGQRGDTFYVVKKS